LLFLQGRLSGQASHAVYTGGGDAAFDKGAPRSMIGSLGFLSPWLLVAVAALPLIWLILRLTPPRPRQVDFPPPASCSACRTASARRRALRGG
jgi:hypothetical protein